MRKLILIILVFISILAIGIRLGTKPISDFFNLTPRSGLRVESNKKAKILVNNKEVGNTPYQDENLSEGDYLVALKLDESTSSANLSWQGFVKLNGGTLSVINRDIAPTLIASSGEVITLEKGQGVTIISTPNQAEVYIDNKLYGRTPITISQIATGEHQFIISKDNFLKRSIRATLVDNYNLTLNVDLAITEPDLTKVPTVPIQSVQQVTIKSTPTGFLRVRATPSLNAAEVARVSPGDKLTLIEEVPSWMKVKLSDGKEGYISSTYAQKAN